MKIWIKRRGQGFQPTDKAGALFSLLLLSALLTGCNLSTQGEPAALKPLDVAAWPTPRPTVAPPSPTPFPKVDPAQVRRVDDKVAAPTSVGVGAFPAQTRATTDATAGADTPVTTAVWASTRPAETGTTARVTTTARVRGPKGLNVRQGPGTSFPIITVLRSGESVTVLGVNDPARDWASVQTSAGKQGWVSLPLLDVSGPLADLSNVPAVLASQSPVPTPQSPVVNRQSSVVNAQSLLVFQLSSGGDIMVANADGSGLRRLTQGIDPVLSPDGKSVAFTRWNGTDGSLWVVGVDGGDELQVAGGIKQGKHPTWSPDGKRVAVNLQHQGRLDPARKCTSLESGEVPGIPWNVDPDSVGVETKVEMRGPYPYPIPYLCYTAPPDPHWSVRIVDLDTGETHDQVTDTYAFGPEWDPANPWRIVTSGLNGLDQLDVNRQAVWELTDRREDHTPVFSPDGRYLAVAHKTGGRYDIHRLDANGAGRVQLTKTPLWLVAEKDKPQAWNSVAPAWSPDGSQIAFLTDRTGRWEIWVMGADGSNQRPMFGEALNSQLHFEYDFVDERMLSWGEG